MQQKAALCRALIRRPAMLFLDEPFSGLDALTRERFDAELTRIWNDEAITALFVTHAIAEAIFLSDRIIVLTHRPASVAGIVNVSFERPRTPQLLESPKFFEYERRIRGILAGQVLCGEHINGGSNEKQFL
jgi:NitT/TauT family transport system ATP-binding protein